MSRDSRTGVPSGETTRPALGALRHLDAELERLERADLLRVPRYRVPGALDLCSNDYLGYARDPFLAGAEDAGSAGSRLVTGDQPAHGAAETALADWLRAEAALLFSSGYAANVGVLGALVKPGDLLLSDQLNHASIIDGCRLSRGALKIYPHLRVEAVEEALRERAGSTRRWVVTESYFSMDGDSPDLGALRAVCDRYDAGLIVDEAHAVGVFGPEGRGLCAAAGVVPDVLVGTAGKALGLQGAFVVGSAALRTWLWNQARSFVFSTGISPALARTLAVRVGRARADDLRREQLAEVGGQIARLLRDAGAEVMGSGSGPVLPWLVGDSRAAIEIARGLAHEGVHLQAIRPPTVPDGSARLRVTAHALLTQADLVKLTTALRQVCPGRCFT